MSLIERLLTRTVADARVAEAIAGDLAEEGVRMRALHLLALTLRFAVRLRPHRRCTFLPGSKPMSTLLQDVRYAARVLLRQPGFTLIAVVTFAVGLGANAAVFAMVDGLLFRPLPLANIDGMVQVYETNSAQGEEREGVSPPNFLDWQRQARSFERMVGIEWWDASLSDRAHEPEQVVGRRVSVDFFDALRVQPVRGRTFARGEDTIGAHRVAIVSYRLWQRRWGGSTSLVGSTITIDREPYTIVGIAPAGLEYPSGAEIWAPLTFDSASITQRTRRYLEVIGRPKPGLTIEQVRVEMAAIAARLAQEHRDENGGYGVNVMPLSRAMLDIGMPAIMAILQIAVALVLLIAGANVANLLMVRGSARQRELALRLAVGASRWRIVRQLVVEGVVLAVVGVVLALPIAAGGIRVMKSFMPPEIARWILGWGEVDVDGRLLGSTMVIGVLAGILFSVVPALRASRPDLTDALKEGARGTSGGRRRALQGFVVAQVALALALLVSAGLSTRGAITLLVQDDGYEPRGVMTFGVTLPDTTYPDAAARLRFVEQVLERVRALPQVEHLSFSSTVPFGDGGTRWPVEVEGRPVNRVSERPEMDFYAITPEYFRVIRATMIKGRSFTDGDRAGEHNVAIIDQNMAGRLWPGADPMGRRFRPTHVPDAPWLTVIGVASNVKRNWFFGFRPTFYVPYAQSTRSYGVLAVRTRGDETTIAPPVREVVRGIDASLPLANVHSMMRWRSLRTVGMQFVAGLMAAFAGIGLFLSSIGIYGVMAYSVSRRTREIGVRMALGATAHEVMRMTLRDAVSLAIAGIAIGLLAAFALGKLLVASMFGVVQLDLVTFAVFATVLAIVAVIAGSVPARRAMRIDPINALRAE